MLFRSGAVVTAGRIGVFVMKLLVCIGLCMFLCAGCGKSVGSFHDDSINTKALSKEIDSKINTGEWNSEPLQVSEALSDAEMIYGIEEAFCDEVLIRKAIVDAACEEIVIVHCKGDHQKDIIEQFKQYQEGRIAAYDKLLNQQKLVKQAEIITYGNYVLFVCSKDKANVLQYMRSIAE